ncbi:MAG: phage major capsid protein [Burkholderiales bacterium]|nr:phage major capsid protein [Burkholderiales bacterium]
MFASFRRSRGVILTKFKGVYDAAFQFTGGAPLRGRHPDNVMVRVRTAPSTLGWLIIALALGALAYLLTSLTADLAAGLSLAAVTPMVSKDRTAAKWRDEANKVRAQMLDEKVTLTREQAEKMQADIAVFEARAQAAAGFTGDEEISRQGGEGDLVRIDGSEEGRRDERKEASFRTMKDAHDEVRAELRTVFPSMGAFLRACRNGVDAGGEEASVLKRVAEMTRTITGSTFGGEYLLPLTQVQEIFSISNQQPGLMERSRRYNVPGRSLRIPYLKQDEGTNILNRPMAGKIAAIAIVGEGQEKPAREPSFGQRVLEMFKYAAHTPFGDEILSDDFTGELPGEVISAVGSEIMNQLNAHCTIDGTGTGMPLGALNANNGAILAVNRTSAGDFTVDDAFAMYVRHTLGPNSVWLVSRRVNEKLMRMTLTNNGLVTWLTDLRSAPVMLLLGIPVVVTDFLNPLGSRADVALVNGDFYAFGLRQALTVESSIHAKFIDDVTVYRFFARGGGIPLPTSTYAYKVDGSGNKVDPHSPFTILDVPASS